MGTCGGANRNGFGDGAGAVDGAKGWKLAAGIAVIPGADYYGHAALDSGANAVGNHVTNFIGVVGAKCLIHSIERR